MDVARAMSDDVEALAEVLCEGSELAYDNIHADWARESIARTILASDWLAEVKASAYRAGLEAGRVER